MSRRFASAHDFEPVARSRLPGFMRDYLFKGLGEGLALCANRSDLQAIRLMPRYGVDDAAPKLETLIGGQRFAAPFAVAPMGLAGLIWPDSETAIAEGAMEHGVGHVLSAYSNRSMEEMAPITGANGWFQHYPPNIPEIEDDILARAKACGYHTLVVTVDIPGPTRREHDIRNGMSVPPVITAPILMQILGAPRWALGTLRHGVPDFGNLSPYYPKGASLAQSAEHIGRMMIGHISARRFERIRAHWDGPVHVKGVLDADDARFYRNLGADGIIVSNHGGRQLDAAPSAVSSLPAIRRALGDDALVMADGGIRSGLDILRMIALGADFVLIGRPFLMAAIAMGRTGPAHLAAILKDEMTTNMNQLGVASPVELRRRIAT